MLKLKILLAISVVLNLTLGIFKAQDLGKIKGLEEVNQIYLSVACTALPTFRSTLEGYNTDHLPIELTPEQKQSWVEKHLSGCNADKSAIPHCELRDDKNGEPPYYICR